MRSCTGGPLCIAAAAAFFVVLAATPAHAEPPERPEAAATPAARAVPLSRYLAPTRSNDVTVLVDGAVAFATTLTQADQIAAEIVTTQVQLDAISSLSTRRAASTGRLEREALRLGDPTVGLPSTLSVDEVDAALQLRALREGLRSRLDALLARQVLLSRAGATALPAVSTPWTRPSSGEITQRFGPTRVRYEPARVVDGVWFAHYHDGVDYGAEMYTPVVAAAPGVVTFVGHLTDGAEVVFIAHAGGYVSEYGHLDDRVAPPSVAVGDVVSPGQTVGYVGMTGNTTGPHLHFEVWKDGTLVDPLTLTQPR
jgi:murein DD-endopeptidase MepM/ murein hydrolase activator NlpD